jgi:hypothetical protein
MDEPESFEDLLRPDELTLRFTPLGFATGSLVMRPEGSLRHLQESIGAAHLADEVPEDVWQSFDRLRKLYLYGVLDYDLFTLAEDLAHLMLEATFRVRFVSYYDSRVPILVKGAQATLLASSFDAVREAVKRGWRLDVNGAPAFLPLDLTRLFVWARRERLLPGQRSMVLDDIMADRRNAAAHPVNYTVGMPVGVGRTLSHVAEIINKLWGVDTPGGRLSLDRRYVFPQAIALAPDGRSSVEFPSLLSVREDDPKFRDWIYTIYLASPDEGLVRVGGNGPKATHRPGFETTMFPCELLWGPGPRDELIPQLDRFEDESLCDDLEYLDRVFVIRIDGDRPDDARSPKQFYASLEKTGVWHVVRADHPLDAWCHVRDHLDRPVGEPADGRCPDCPVTELGRFESREDTVRCLELE